MNTTSRQPVVIDIFGTIEHSIWSFIKIGLQFGGFCLWVIFAPVLYLFFGLYCARYGAADMAMIYCFTLPVAVAVWTFVICRRQAVRKWRREGGEGSWRLENGWGRTMVKGFGYMIAGGFFSFVAELIATNVWHFRRVLAESTDFSVRFVPSKHTGKPNRGAVGESLENVVTVSHHRNLIRMMSPHFLQKSRSAWRSSPHHWPRLELLPAVPSRRRNSCPAMTSQARQCASEPHPCPRPPNPYGLSLIA